MAKVYGFNSSAVARRLRDFAFSLSTPGSELASPFPGTFKVEELVRFKNSAESDCPGGAVMLIDTEEEDDDNGLFTTIKQPTKEFKPYQYLVNVADQAEKIEQDGFGWAVRLEKADWVLADNPGSSSTKADQLWGPKENEWKLFKDLPGFISTGGSRDDEDTGNFFVRAIQKVRPEKVQAWNEDADPAGKLIAPNSDMLIPGRLARYNADSDQFGTELKCWILFSDYFSVDSADTTKASIGVQGRLYDGYPGGYFDHAGDTRAIYVTLAGPQVFLAKTATKRTKGTAAASFKLYNKDRTDSTITRNAIPLGSDIKADKWATVKRFDDGEWYVGCWE